MACCNLIYVRWVKDFVTVDWQLVFKVNSLNFLFTVHPHSDWGFVTVHSYNEIEMYAFTSSIEVIQEYHDRKGKTCACFGSHLVY